MGNDHHKSYHPYRLNIIERLRKEVPEEARRKVESEDSKMMLASPEACIDLLRGKSASLDKTEKKNKRRDDDDDLKDLVANSSTRGQVLPTTIGPFSLFENSRQSSLMPIKATKKVTPTETEKSIPRAFRAPPAKDLKHLFPERTREQPAEEQDGKRKPDESRKHVHDSFTSLTKQLAAHPASSSSSSYRPSLSPKANRDKPSEVQAWLSIESTERERASELIRPKKKTVPDTRRNGEGGEELVLVPNKCDECLKGKRQCLRPKGKERCESCAKSKRRCTLVTPRQSLKKGKGREQPRKDGSVAGSSDEEDSGVRIGPPKPKKRKMVRSSPEVPAPPRAEVAASRSRRQPSPPIVVVESDDEPILNVSVPLTVPPAPIPPANLQPPSSVPSVDDLQLHIRILQTEVDASQRELHTMREAQILQLERREEAMAAQFARQRAIYEERIRDLSRESEPLRRYIAELEAEVSRLKSGGA